MKDASFKRKSRLKNDHNNVLSAKELIKAEPFIFQEHQLYHYENEYKKCLSKKPLLSGILKALNVFVDEVGLIRASSRFQSKFFSYEERNPIVLAPWEGLNSKAVSIRCQVINDAHRDNLHTGILSTMGTIRQKFHIPFLRRGVQKCINKCLICTHLKHYRQQQLMGKLPNECLEILPCFSNVTLDLLGPINIVVTNNRIGPQEHDH